MISKYIDIIDVMKALRKIVRASNVGANSFHVLRSYDAYIKDGDTMGAKPSDYDAELFYDRNYEQTGLLSSEFAATYPRMIAEHIAAPNINNGYSNDEIQLTYLDLCHAETENDGTGNDKNFKVIENDGFKTLIKAVAQLQGFEKRMSPDGTQIAFGHKSEFASAPYNTWTVTNSMKEVLGSRPNLSLSVLPDNLNDKTAGVFIRLNTRLTLDPCGVEADYVTPCSGGQTSFELDVNGETITVTGETYTLEVLQDGELVGTVTLGENSGTVVIPVPDPCEDATVTVNEAEFASVASGDTLDIAVVNSLNTPVTVDITEAPKIILFDTLVRANGVELPDVVAGELVNFAIRNEANTNVGVYLNDHHWQIRNADLLLNGTVVDDLIPETNKALTTTLNGTAHPATYTAGTINLAVTIPTQSGIVYRRQTTTQGDIYEANDTGTRFQANFYNPANVPYPVSFAQLDPTDTSRSTLLSNNIHGNKRRFTLPNGGVPAGLYNVAATHSGGAITVYVVEDHYLGCCWVGWNTTATFTANLALIASLNVTGIGTGLAPLCDGGVQDIQVANGAAVSNLLVDNGFTAATYWTGLTNPATTTQGYRMQTTTQGVSAQTKSTANRGIAFKFF